nr:BREX-1 system adenine-specific DNA-methyltransferase PglX [uncultured Alloprevotella sp.]
MNTSLLKRFATEARTKVKQGVARMMSQWGFDDNGEVKEEPILLQGGTLFRQQVIEGEHIFYQWQNLHSRIQQEGLQHVYEEVAYTWFNRMIAIKVLSKNGLLEPYLDYTSSEGHPITGIVEQARRGIFPYMSEATKRKVIEIIDDHNRDAELLALLITEVCHNTPILSQCFGRLNDYTELLFPRTIAAQGNLLDMLNDDKCITDEDYRQPELIGWLYQFYIAERKDEVFAQFKDKKKASKDDIPAATQIFTPNWIVKYMVQNSLGRIYLDNTPRSRLASQWKYLITPAEGYSPEQHRPEIKDAEELTCIDAACGSGHILVEAFDLLYGIYEEQYASPREACEAIFTHNLVGIDLDTRAKQLAMFALLMKACSYVPEMADCRVMPRVFDMPDPLSDEVMKELRDSLPHFFLGEKEQVMKETIEALKVLQLAPELGSIMQLNLSASTRYAIERALERPDSNTFPYAPQLHLALALTRKYAAVVMNPPYMGRKNMNPTLAKYVEKHYPEGKADLFATFMLISKDMLIENGKYAMINMQSWMFLSYYENLREKIIKEVQIESMLHLGPRTFDELGGEIIQNVAFVISHHAPSFNGMYYRLVDGKSCTSKDQMFLNAQQLDGIYYPNISQQEFSKIPGSPIAYWVSEKTLRCLSLSNLSVVAAPYRTIQCGDVPRFVRVWHEVCNKDIETETSPNYLRNLSAKTWFRFSNGGKARKWYGNLDSVLLWKGNGKIIKETGKAIIPNEDLYLESSIGYNRITSSEITARHYDNGILLGDATSMLTPNKNSSFLLGLLNSCISDFFMSFFNPTLAAQTGSLANLPVAKYSEEISITVNLNVSISREDWDAHETSWDFKENELVRLSRAHGVNKLSEVVELYKQYWGEKFHRLHANEEELNRKFIDIYGLQDELTPEIPLNEVTILQQGEISIADDQLCWNEAIVVKQLISYAMGVWMGRYRLDKAGLHIAHPAPGAEEIAPYTFRDVNVEMDDDGIVPLLPEDAPFADNARERIIVFLTTVFGQAQLIDNLNFVEQTLGKSLSDYLVKDFWKEHKSMYKNCPIYWLFRSKKGAFQCLTYMHRMDEYSLERIRQKYLLPYIEHLSERVKTLKARESLNIAETKQLNKLQKLLEECREYHDRLHQYSQQNISFDLDDGVIKNYALMGDVVAKLK